SSNAWTPGSPSTSWPTAKAARTRRRPAWERACIRSRTTRLEGVESMRMTSQWQRLCASLIGVVAGLCASCGGEETAGIEGSGAPVATSVVTTGRITGFGSIIVDGVEYATSGATIRIDDQSATEAQLHVGDVVTIKGTLNSDGVSGAAMDVSFTADARG